MSNFVLLSESYGVCLHLCGVCHVCVCWTKLSICTIESWENRANAVKYTYMIIQVHLSNPANLFPHFHCLGACMYKWVCMHVIECYTSMQRQKNGAAYNLYCSCIPAFSFYSCLLKEKNMSLVTFVTCLSLSDSNISRKSWKYS